MLSRTAAEIYWLSRYLERAENTARMLDVAWNLSLIPVLKSRNDLHSPLIISGSMELYVQRYGTLQVNNVLHFFTLDAENPGSIYNCIRMARENAHAVRGKITGEMWESINAAWIEIQDMERVGILSTGISTFFDWVKQRSHLFRGAAYSTMMRNDAFRFLRVGTFIERADNTARILSSLGSDAGGEVTGDATDYYHWNALLRSVGAFEAYREIYRDGIQIESIIELLVFRADVPRSLLSCLEMLCELIPAVEGDAGTHVKRLCAVLYAHLQYGDRAKLAEAGIESFLADFLKRINEIAERLREEYLEVP